MNCKTLIQLHCLRDCKLDVGFALVRFFLELAFDLAASSGRHYYSCPGGSYLARRERLRPAAVWPSRARRPASINHCALKPASRARDNDISFGPIRTDPRRNGEARPAESSSLTATLSSHLIETLREKRLFRSSSTLSIALLEIEFLSFLLHFWFVSVGASRSDIRPELIIL